MKKQHSIAIKLLLAGALSAACWVTTQPAQAGSAQANLGVSASVSANCTISTSAVSFGSYDPISANASSPLDSTGSVSVQCTSGASASITLDEGLNPTGSSTAAAPARQMNDGGSNNLAYSLYQDSSHSTIWGNTSGTGEAHSGDGASHSLTVYGRIAGGQNVPVGTYSDTVVATIAF